MKKLTVFFLSIIISIFFITGCSKEKNQSSDTDKSKAEIPKSAVIGSNKVVFSSGLWSVPSQREYIKRVIMAGFEKKTGISVDYRYIMAKDIINVLLLQRAMNNIMVDIVTIGSGDMPKFIDQGFMENLNPYMEEYFDDITIFKVFNNVTNKNGKAYFLPIVADVYITVANRKALKYLPKGCDVNDLTWNDFVQWSHNIRKGEGVGKTVFSGAPMNSLIYEYGAIELSYGAKFLDLTTKPALKAWEIMVELRKDYTPDILNTSTAKDSLLKGIGWITIIHIADGGATYDSDPTKFIVARVPKGPVGRGTISGAYGIGIPKGSKNKRNALKLMQYLLSPKIQADIARGTGGFVPPVKQAFEYLGNNPSEKVIKIGLETFNTAIISGVPSDKYWDWNAVKIIFDNLFKNMVIGKGKVDIKMLEAAKVELMNLNKAKSKIYKDIKPKNMEP
ncbi:MAG TPA: extracellular solute-binding protein [Victivallales bacterium]|nr:extracellular solute-binding protein [Victivallales bacterium]